MLLWPSELKVVDVDHKEEVELRMPISSWPASVTKRCVTYGLQMAVAVFLPDAPTVWVPIEGSFEKHHWLSHLAAEHLRFPAWLPVVLGQGYPYWSRIRPKGCLHVCLLSICDLLLKPRSTANEVCHSRCLHSAR